MRELTSGSLRLSIQQGADSTYHFLTEVRDGDSWHPACRWPTRPVNSLMSGQKQAELDLNPESAQIIQM